MSAANGVLHPPQSDPSAQRSTPGKRKRGSSVDEASDGNRDGTSDITGHSGKAQLDQTMQDLLHALKRFDSDSLLQHPLPLRQSTEPETKRAKLAGDTCETSTIESRISSGEYQSIQELVNDIDSASKIVIEQRQRNDAGTNGVTHTKPGADVVTRVAAFKKHLDNFLRRTSLKDISRVKSEPRDGSEESSVNGDVKRTLPREQEKTALTIYGNSLNPKQLFSSLKRPTKVDLQAHDPEATSSIEIQTPFNETGLPNGISVTKVVPHNGADLKNKKNARTIGEAFPPRASLPQLEPPRKGKPGHKSSNITWADWFDVAVDSRALPNERGSYIISSLPSGKWLDYGGGSATKNSSGTQQGSGGSRQPDNVEHGEFVDEKTLFQSVYSSFAPSFDSSGSIVPEDVKDQMWWNKAGEKRFGAFLSSQYPEDELTGPDGSVPEDNTTALQDLDEATLEEAVNSFTPENEFREAPKPKDDNGNIEDKDMEELLNEIGELLETLNSYNRIRNLGPPGARSGNESAIGAPDTPSTAEREVYETLKASLSAMIATLPPYAVAKLNGEQLSDLNISKKMLVENIDYPGTMEPDDYTAQQRHASRIAATAATSRTPAPGMGVGSRSNSYHSPATSSSANQRPIPSNPRSQTPRGYPSQQAYAARHTPQSTHYQPNLAPQNYQAPRQPASTPQRPLHGTPKYPQSASSQYGSQGSTLQQFQRAGSSAVGRYSPQQGHLPPHGSPQQFQQRPAQPGYPQRGPESVYNTSLAGGRSASPQKPQGYGTPQPHSPYMNSPSAQQRYIHPQQQPHNQVPQQHQLHHYNNFPPSRTPQIGNSAPNSATIAATMPYQRSAAEQAALMDRNKTQLDIHQQRQNSITPQPSHSMSPIPPSSQPRTESFQGMNHTPGNLQNGMTNVNAAGGH